MGIKRRTRIWTSVGTAALLGGIAGCSEPAGTPAIADTQNEAVSSSQTSAPGFSEGEGESGSSGGEFGIDPVEAGTNPVVYLIALEVMRAHYLAGIDAFEAGERAAGAEMFAHPISEIYLDFEPVLESRGAPLFGDAMIAASVAPFNGESDEAIAEHVANVLTAIDAASAFMPDNQLSPAGIHARVLADLIERSALQYEVLETNPDAHEPYLDGYGFSEAARRYAGGHLDVIAASDPDLSLHLGQAIAALAIAFPTATRPDVLTGESPALLALAEGARTGADALR